jgi:hypothetical protein
MVRVQAGTNRPLIVLMSIGTMSFVSEFQFANVVELVGHATAGMEAAATISRYSFVTLSHCHGSFDFKTKKIKDSNLSPRPSDRNYLSAGGPRSFSSVTV